MGRWSYEVEVGTVISNVCSVVSRIDEPVSVAPDAARGSALELDVPVLAHVRLLAPPSLFDLPWAGEGTDRSLELAGSFESGGGVVPHDRFHGSGTPEDATGGA